MNGTSNHSVAVSNTVSCDWTFDDQFVDNLFSVLSIILNLLTCPLTVLLNNAGHNRCQDKTKTSDYASLNTGLYGRYRFGSRYSCPASVHRQRNFTPNRWNAFDVLQPKHIDHDNNNSSFPDVSFSSGANFRRAFDSNEIFLKIQLNDIVTKRRLTAAVALCWLFAAINLTIRLTVTRITDVFVMIITPMIFTVIFQFILFVVAI